MLANQLKFTNMTRTLRSFPLSLPLPPLLSHSLSLRPLSSSSSPPKGPFPPPSPLGKSKGNSPVILKGKSSNFPQITSASPFPNPYHSDFQEGLLTRDFIACSLYSPYKGYFNTAGAPTRIFQSADRFHLNFMALKGREHYLQEVTKLYAKYPDCWLTPVEIFKPIWGEAIARWVLDTRRKDTKDPLWWGSDPKSRESNKMKQIKGEREREERLMKILQNSPQSSLGASPSVSPFSAYSPSPDNAYVKYYFDNPNNLPGNMAGESDVGNGNSLIEVSSSSSSLTSSKPLRIIEVGGGNGTLALNILDYFQLHHPHLYDILSYTIVDISSQMRDQQHKTLKNHLESGRVHIVNMNILDWSVFIDDDVFVVGMEFLDNLPHDKVIYFNGIPMETHIYSGPPITPDSVAGWREMSEVVWDQYHETYQEVNDPIIAEYLEISQSFEESQKSLKIPQPKMGRINNHVANAFNRFNLKLLASLQHFTQQHPPFFVPSVQLMFLHILRIYFPKSHVCFADFDTLTGSIGGMNSPLVQAKSNKFDGKSKVFSSYLVELGAADIFFPTDFEMLWHSYYKINKKEGDIQSVWQFMTEYADWKKCDTQGTFNPILEDYVNFRFFTS